MFVAICCNNLQSWKKENVQNRLCNLRTHTVHPTGPTILVDQREQENPYKDGRAEQLSTGQARETFPIRWGGVMCVSECVLDHHSDLVTHLPVAGLLCNKSSSCLSVYLTIVSLFLIHCKFVDNKHNSF